MLQLGGIKKKYKGGHSPSPLSPATYKLGENMASGAEPNFSKLPNAFPSNQVGGGGYGFTSGGDVTPFGGSYAPFARYGGEVPDATRGGNNVVQTGGRRRKNKSQSQSKSQRKWRMKGCSRKKRKGGNNARGRGGSTKKRSTKKKRSTNNRRYGRHKTMRAGCGSCKLSPAPY
jgi:hypothetical protein